MSDQAKDPAAGQASDDKQGWAEAEALVRKGYEKKRKKVTQLEPYPALPYLFSAVLGDGSEHVLVSGGRVVTERGLPALGAYLDKSGVLARPGLGARDLVHLVEVLGAYPPVKGYASPPGYYTNPKEDAPLSPLNPRLLREGPAGAARLQLHYLIRTPSPPSGGSPSGAETLRVARWTLAMAPGAAPAWKEERLLFDSRSGQFHAEP